VETLERGLVPPDRLAGALALIRRNLDVEVRLIDDLLDVRRIVHGKLTLERRLVDLHDSGARRRRRLGQRSPPRRLARRAESRSELAMTSTGTPLACGRSSGISSAMPFGTRRPRVRSCSPRSTRSRAGLALTVCDTGRGIAAHRLATIFEPFDQVDPPGRRRGGLGLGLAICRGIVEAHGGTVSAAARAWARGDVHGDPADGRRRSRVRRPTRLPAATCPAAGSACSWSRTTSTSPRR
jgi:signal transduction histidine kinase